MPAMHISFRHRDDSEDKAIVNHVAEYGMLLHDNSGDWHVILIGEGMESGKPSVMVWIPTTGGSIFLETSLDAWRAATVALASIAEEQFGYRMSD